MSHVIVIGAGVVGASVAHRLTEAGMRVTVLEAGHVGCGTSSATFGWTNSNNKKPKAYHDMNVAGMRAHLMLRQEFGRAPWFHDGGNVEWTLDAKKMQTLRDKVEMLRGWGYAAEWITPKDLKHLEPDVDVTSVGDAPIAFFPEEGWVNTMAYAHAMTRAAVRLGAVVRTGERVTAIEQSGGRITGVRTAGGETLGADVVVNCAGRWVNDVAGDRPELRIPTANTPGLIVITKPAPADVHRVLHAPTVHIRPDGGSRLYLHRWDSDDLVRGDSAPANAMDHAREVVASAVTVLPGIAGVEPESVRVGVRPVPKDSYPAVGPLPGLSGYYLVVSHSAVTLAPFYGRAVAAEIAHGKTEPLLEAFRPQRFFQALPTRGS